MTLNKFITSVIVIFAIYDVSVRPDKCITPNGEQAECVSVHNCPAILEAIKTEDETAAAFAKKSQCGYDKVPLVCCGSTGYFSKPATDLLPNQRYCGLQHSDDYISDRNNQNGTSSINEFPWLAALIYVGNGKEENLCVGSLINDRYVLTTGHCVGANPRKLILNKVRLGEYNIKQNKDCVSDGNIEECSDPTAEFEIEETITNENFNLAKRLHDIALIRLNRTVQYSDYIRPICLPLSGGPRAQVGDILAESGWGTVKAEVDTSIIKKKVLAELISHADCKKHYAQRVEITEDHLCTREFNQTTSVCQGDSGGPVMYSHKTKWYQEGIVAFGYKCGYGYPDVHVKVASYVDWILRAIRR